MTAPAPPDEKDRLRDLVVTRTGFSPDQLHSYAQVASTALIASVGACYAAGYAVINLRLSTYGVYTPGFLRAEYVLAGAAFLVLVGVAYIAFSYGFQLMQTAHVHRRSGRRSEAIRGYVLSLAVAFLPTWLLISRVAGSGLGFRDSAWTTFFMFGLVAGLDNIRLNWHMTRSNTGTPYRLAINRLLYFGTVLSGVFGITVYAHFVYPLISSTYGGGKRAPIILLMSEEGARAAQQLVLPVSVNNRLVGLLTPLSETDAEFVILTEQHQGYHPKANAVRIKKEYVEAVINLTRIR